LVAAVAVAVVAAAAVAAAAAVVAVLLPVAVEVAAAGVAAWELQVEALAAREWAAAQVGAVALVRRPELFGPAITGEAIGMATIAAASMGTPMVTPTITEAITTIPVSATSFAER
jgi:hypothetical protein